MKNSFKNNLLLVTVLGMGFLGAQFSFAQQEHQPIPGEVLSKLKAGDPEVLLDAGRLGMSETKPLISAHLHDARQGTRDAAQMALAKMGDVRQLSRIAQEIECGSPGQQYEAFGKLAYVGGWFSISRLKPFLANKPYNLESIGPENSDEGGVRWILAVASLEEILQRRLPDNVRTDRELASQKMLAYISQNRQTLQRLRPTNIRATSKGCTK